MNTKKTTMIYRPLLKEAWRLSWTRKTLWFFGIFAAFVSTGGVLDIATTGTRRLQLGGSVWQQLWDLSFTSYSVAARNVWHIRWLETSPGPAPAIVLTLLFVGILFLAVLSQTALIHGIKSPEHERVGIIHKRAHDHLFRIFAVDVLTKLAGGIIICLTAFPMLWVYAQTGTHPFVLTLAQVLFFFPAVLILSILSVLSVIHIIETESSVSEAICEAWRTFSTHWIATLEYGFILFCLSAVATLALLASVVVLSIPYALFYTTSLLTGSFTIFVITNVLVLAIALGILFMIGGGIITFQYSAWYLFYKRTGHHSHPHAPLAKLLRLSKKNPLR